MRKPDFVAREQQCVDWPLHQCSPYADPISFVRGGQNLTGFFLFFFVCVFFFSR